jgi:hypothetical protein
MIMLRLIVASALALFAAVAAAEIDVITGWPQALITIHDGPYTQVCLFIQASATGERNSRGVLLATDVIMKIDCDHAPPPDPIDGCTLSPPAVGCPGYIPPAFAPLPESR